MKKCTKCSLSVEEGAVFTKDKSGKDGLRSICGECGKKYKKQYRQSERGREVTRKYSQSKKGKNVKKIYQEKYRTSKERKESSRKYSQSKKGKASRKIWHEEYRLSKVRKESLKKYKQSEKGRANRKEYDQSEEAKATKRKYCQSEKGRAAQKRGRQTEAAKKSKKRYYVKNSVSICIAAGIRHSLKGNKDGHHWEDVVGWTLQQFKRRFVQLFKEGMMWENYGKVWEIDHIQPVSAHNITSMDCTDFKRAWALSNLQPLFKKENRSKSNKLKKHFQPTLF